MNALLAEGPVDYARYIDAVLYTPACGYYRRDKPRVGRDGKTDFYTAESLGPVFARLVVEACVSLLPPELRPEETTFVEIGAEPGRCLLDLLDHHPFKASRVIRPADPCRVEGAAVVFANEWLDALPFHRLCYVEGAWRERGVVRTADGQLRDCLLPALSGPVAKRLHTLPAEASEGWQLDWPIAAEVALERLSTAAWPGAIVLFDYGRRLEALLESFPEGTARTYRAHQTGTDLLDSPGDQDITCDVIWDPLESILRNTGFSGVSLRRQEAFFIESSSRALEAIVRDRPGEWNRDRMTLMELIHPGNLGAKFQVLSGTRASTMPPP